MMVTRLTKCWPRRKNRRFSFRQGGRAFAPALFTFGHFEMRSDPEMMLAFVDHLFGGDLDGLQDGLIELAWTNAADGKLSRAQLFGTDDLEGLVEHAAQLNEVDGQNMYLGAALRKPDTGRSARCTDEHFLAATAFWADIDDAKAIATVATKYGDAPPTAALFTGRTPHARGQLWWRQDTPRRDPNEVRRQNKALASSGRTNWRPRSSTMKVPPIALTCSGAS